MADICELSEEYYILDPLFTPYSNLEWDKILRDNDIYRVCPYRLKFSLRYMFPKCLRKDVWLFLSKAEMLEATGKPYSHYLLTNDISIQKLILKDIGRTFPYHQFFASPCSQGQQKLLNILTAYSNYDQQAMYCQGMNFIVGILLLYLPEEKAFWAFVSIMFQKDWRGMFTENTPKLSKLLLELKSRIEKSDAELFNHFAAEGIDITVFAKYFLTLFSCDGNIELATRVIDIFLCDGDEALFSLLVNAINFERCRLLKLNYEELFMFLSKKLGEKCLEILNGQTLKLPEIDDEYTML